jgi:CheY-like chemotaxis protein
MQRTSFHILIADDDVDDQELMKEGLKDCRVNVKTDTVSDGVQVMDYLLGKQKYRGTSHKPDLILLDLNMPLMDGFAVLKEVKKYPHMRPIPIYVITTSRSVDHINRALQLGANGFYSKGASSSEIVKIMREVCAECFEPSVS